MKEKSCCFTGHRPQSLPCGFNERHPDCIKIKTQLARMITEVIEERGVTHFITGMALGIDIWAAEIVLDLKEKYPDITIEAAIPCKTQTRNWKPESIERYDRLLSHCNKVTYVQEHYSPDCMMKRNRYMVDNSDCVIAVWNGSSSGTGKTISCAQQQGKPVYCLNLIGFRRKDL